VRLRKIELEEIEGITVLETNDGFLPGGGASSISATTALCFTSVVTSADTENLHLEEFLDGVLDLNLVGATIDFKGVGVFVLLKKGCLLRHADGIDDGINISHGLLSLGGALSEGFKSIVKNDHGSPEEEFLDVDVLGGLKEGESEVPLGSVSFFGKFFTDDDDTLGICNVTKCFYEILCLTGGNLEGFRAEDEAFVDFLSKNTLESEGANLLRNGLSVGAIARSEGDSTTDEDRSFTGLALRRR